MAKEGNKLSDDEKVLDFPVLYVACFEGYTQFFKVTNLTQAQYDCIHMIVSDQEPYVHNIMDLLNPKIKKRIANWREMDGPTFRSNTTELNHDDFMSFVKVIGAETMDRVFLSSSYPSKVEETFNDLEPLFVYHLIQE